MTKRLSVVLLAAGVSSRFWPLREKYAFPFFGKSLLVRQLEHIATLSPDTIVIVTNDENESIIRQSIPKTIKNVHLVRQKGEGQAAAIVAAATHIRGAALILNTSDIYDQKLLQDVHTAWERERCIIVPVKELEDYFPGGYIKLRSDGTVSHIIEKPPIGQEPSKLVRLVAEIVPSLEALAKEYDTDDDPKDGEVALLNKVFAKGERAIPHTTDQFWAPIKYPWHILDVMGYVLNEIREHRGKNVEIKQNVVIEGRVSIGDNVKIFENSKIVGPCYIGDNTIIGNNNIIRHSHIGAGCVTGFNTDITRSYIGDTCWFHSNYVGDSVLEGNVSMGSGAVLANLRLDEGPVHSMVKGERVNTGRDKLGAIIARDVRIGVNTSVMPGVKIGAGSFIGAGLVIGQDVPDESFCMGKVELQITKNTSRVAPRSQHQFRY